MPRKAALLSPIKEAGALKYLLKNDKIARREKATLLTKARHRHPQSIKSSQTHSRHADFDLQTSIPKSQMKNLGERGRYERCKKQRSIWHGELPETAIADWLPTVCTLCSKTAASNSTRVSELFEIMEGNE